MLNRLLFMFNNENATDMFITAKPNLTNKSSISKFQI